MTEPTLFQQKLAEKRAREAELNSELKQAVVSESFDSDLVPESEYSKTPEEDALESRLNQMTIIEAYRFWCNKSPINIRGNQHESIMISCPKPNHPDKKPSAWINSDKGTWFCGGCNEGGDKYDIAAYALGFPVPGYKDGIAFHDLRRKMGSSLGFTYIQPPGVPHPIPIAPSHEDSDGSFGDNPVMPDGERGDDNSNTGEQPQPLATVTPIPSDPSWDDEEIVFPTLEWRSIMQPGTFLDTYMNATHIDDVPEEYHFWNGLLALGFAGGRDVTLYDRVPVYGNLFICLLGNTGDGKSRSFSHFRKLITQALPHKWEDQNSKGVRVISTPASAEVLIHNFSKPMYDPTDPKKVVGYSPVRGLIEYNELSSLMGRASRQGNAIKPALMEFYDGSPNISTVSMATGLKQADNPFGSAFTTTQPLALKELTRRSDVDSGFLNRWIFASGKTKPRIAIGGLEIDINPAVKPLQEIVSWAGFSKKITWDEDAAKLFTKFFHEQLHPKQLADSSGLLVRMDLTFKKLILLLTMNIRQNTVPIEIVTQVISMYNYLISAYAVPGAQVGNSIQIEIQEEILRHVRRLSEGSGVGLTYRELGLRLKRKKYQPKDIHQMLKILCDMGELETVTHTAKGRPTVRYKYVG